MARAYIKGTVKKVFDLATGEGKSGPWSRLDMKVEPEAGGEEQTLKVWGGAALVGMVYEGATIEAHGRLEEYKGAQCIVANYLKKDGTPSGDVTVNGAAPPTAEQAKVVMTSSSPTMLPLSRLAELHGSIGLGAMRCYLDEVTSRHPEAANSPEVIAAAISAGSNAAHTAFIGLNKSAKLEDDLDPDGIPF